MNVTTLDVLPFHIIKTSLSAYSTYNWSPYYFFLSYPSSIDIFLSFFRFCRRRLIKLINCCFIFICQLSNDLIICVICITPFDMNDVNESNEMPVFNTWSFGCSGWMATNQTPTLDFHDVVVQPNTFCMYIFTLTIVKKSFHPLLYSLPPVSKLYMWWDVCVCVCVCGQPTGRSSSSSTSIRWRILGKKEYIAINYHRKKGK